MSRTYVAAFVCYFLTALLSMIFGIVYLMRSKFMPYHQDAIGIPWENLDVRMQTLLLALMRVSGGGFLTSALSILILLFVPFHAGHVWAKYAIPGIGLASALPTLYATILVRRRTPASPPVGLSVFGMVLIILGFLFSLL